MSAFANLKIGRHEIFSMQSMVDPYLMTLYKETDKKRTNSPKRYLYSCPARVMRQRLDLLGFSDSKAVDDFENSKKLLLNDIGERSVKKIVRESTYDEWMRTLTYIYIRRLTPNTWSGVRKIASLQDFILFYDAEGWPDYNYPCSDIRFLYKTFLRNLGYQVTVSLDYSELVDWGTYSPTTKLTEVSADYFSANYPSSEKIIILTEGSTDAHVIKETMKLLYPHIFEYYYFFDFHSTKAEGGAGRLAASVKSFISSGIKNRIIAIFDNDTAGYDAIRPLNSLYIPPNIKVMHLPDVPWAINYPTLGPSGNINMNINRLAGSIELYLGRDVLRINKAKYSPVQWTGYNESLRLYQGVVIDKQKIMDNFLVKLKLCVNNRRLINKYDWSGLKYIIRKITEQFS